MFSPDGTLISASAASHCGGTGQEEEDKKRRRTGQEEGEDKTKRAVSHKKRRIARQADDRMRE